TPVDRTVHVKLQGIEAIHADWQNGVPVPGFKLSPKRAAQQARVPKTITAFMLGLHSKISTFKVQRYINEYKEEPLLAILPGVALQELWDTMGIAEKVLLIISAFVILVGLTGMVTAILTSLNERRREMAILRSVGARPSHIFSLIMGEAIYLTLSGVVLGLILLYLLLVIAQPLIESQFGIFIPVDWPTGNETVLIGFIILSGLIISIIPGYRAYRYSLADGMTIRI
ncbi:MAG: ABC transporter permease, partial [Gammaproteobacteria bacterium]|nr:ABC transporter permease [Gammaproteobacteria bacterium]